MARFPSSPSPRGPSHHHLDPRSLQPIASDGLTSTPARKGPDWSPAPTAGLPGVLTLKTLADVRKLLTHLPKDVRARSTWQHVAAELDKAARGEDTVDVSVPLQMALGMERVDWRRK